jgi:hypothetical protein
MQQNRATIWNQPESVRRVGIELYNELTEGAAVYLEVTSRAFGLRLRLPEPLLTALSKLRTGK